MSRVHRILDGIHQGMRGAEIGAGHAPIAPKRDGWRTLVVDVFDTAHIRATQGPNCDEVDVVAPAHRLAEHVERDSLDFIVSSHNFEHLPDPVRFLQAAETVLRPGGVLSMAVPDHRRCFDTYRPASTLGEMLEAYAERRERPTPRQVFDGRVMRAVTGGIVGRDNPPPLAGEDMRDAWATWESDDYRDAHCWCLTAERCEAILRDLRYLGLISLVVESVQPDGVFEFFARLRKTEEPIDESEHRHRRAALLRRAWKSA